MSHPTSFQNDDRASHGGDSSRHDSLGTVARHRRTRRRRRWLTSPDGNTRDQGRRGVPREFTTRSRSIIISDGTTRSQIVAVIRARRRMAAHHTGLPPIRTQNPE